MTEKRTAATGTTAKGTTELLIA